MSGISFSPFAYSHARRQSDGEPWRITNQIAPLSAQRWLEIFELAADSPDIDQGFGIPELHQIEVRKAAGNVLPFPPSSLRVLSWNVQHGTNIDGLLTLPHFHAADVLLLTEVDVGMARSGNRHIARFVAEQLGYHYTYVTEYLEDSNSDGRARHRGRNMPNEQGMTGKAIISRLPLQNVRALRFPQMQSGRLRKPRRLGSQVALLADVQTCKGAVSLACIHFTRHASPAFRRLQADMLLDVVPRHQPCLMGGDMGSYTTDTSRFVSLLRLPFQLLEDPARFIAPQPYEPLFHSLTEADFRFAYFNDRKPTTYLPRLGHLLRARADWYCGRSLVATGAETVPAVAASGHRLSNHDGIWVQCRI